MKKIFSALLVAGLAATALSSVGCVSDRPSRNGVFNENQYLRKSFIIRDADGSTTDSGWLLRGTIVSTSSPNPLAYAFIVPGATNEQLQLVRFRVTQDKLELVNIHEFDPRPDVARTEEVVNAWPINNVDLKYQVNLDGETSNFYQENQELDWQVRQWVKLQFDKNDASDLQPLGSFINQTLGQCADLGNATVTLVPGTFLVDEPNDYMQWEVSMSFPINVTDSTCTSAYGRNGYMAGKVGKENVTVNFMYSMTRTVGSSQLTYVPQEIDEKDPIRHKYGIFHTTTVERDPDSGLVAARQLSQRWDPEKPLVWYFDQGFPDKYKQVFLGPNGIKEQTNKLFATAGRKITLDFKDFDADLPAGQGPRQFGDIRYNFLRWISDEYSTDGFSGITLFGVDPRSGELKDCNIEFVDYNIQDSIVQRLDAYLQSVGACQGYDKASGTCPNGSSISDLTTPWPDLPQGQKCTTDLPLQDAAIVSNHNGGSTLYAKMQQYLHKPVQTYGSLGPQDFIPPQDQDFETAYYQLLPYYFFADPDMNEFVVREGGSGVLGPAEFWDLQKKEAQFQQVSASIDQGVVPFEDVTGPTGLANATNFANSMRDMTLAHKDYNYKLHYAPFKSHMDGPEAFSLPALMAKNSRHCKADGTYETKQEWVQNLVDSYWALVMWHEFGHSLGLQHNFAASVDKPNWDVKLNADGTTAVDQWGNTQYQQYQSSVMEYGIAPADTFSQPGWAPYDRGAITFIYANDVKNGQANTTQGAISGQTSSSTPWKDPNGFQADGTTERQFLYCHHEHLKYSPFCREGDFGTRPSEIIANQIDMYEWQYKWRNFRTYRKFWDESSYASAPVGLVTDMRRFISLDVFDWNSGEIADTLRRLGIKLPANVPTSVYYYDQLGNKFNAEVSAANQLVAAFHEGIIQQSSGERPFATIYDKYYGDVTQQGIILDKLYAMQGWVGLWPTDNYDPNQAGSYIASYSGAGDDTYDSIAEAAVVSMVGGGYDVYPYFIPLAVAQFAQDTHNPAYGGRIDARDWIGGFVWPTKDFMLQYFRQIAVSNNYEGCDTIDNCQYDPTAPAISDAFNEFTDPSGRVWIWAYVMDRDKWVAVQKERNTATYNIVRAYTTDVIYAKDDGSTTAPYSDELPIKYFLDSYAQYN